MKLAPGEVSNLLKEIREKEKLEDKEIVEKARETFKGEWDVKADQPVFFFDANLSYELTGYKPINDTKGLDFNPDWFTEAKDTFIRTGHYCQFPQNTKAYADFWTTEYKRCRDGLTVNGYTITGDNYYFINYYQLSDLTSATKAGAGRTLSFPSFFAEQYKYFHYLELCKRLRKNVIALKARGVGWSEMDAGVAVNTYNCRRHSRVVIAAFGENYVTSTCDKCWTQLNFLNENTDGGFFKLRQVVDTTDKKRASVYKIINGQKTETGWMSEIEGIIADKPRKIRGDRTDILIYEESGSWPKWKKAFLQGDALVGIQGRKFGIKVAFGTGGDEGANLAGLADAYIHPNVYDALPYKHNYTPTGETILSAYFIPAYTIINLPGYMDKRGVTNTEQGKNYYEQERNNKAEDPQALITYCAEYCFTADEALALEGANKFNKAKIVEQIAQIRLHNQGAKIETGTLEYKFNGPIQKENIDGLKWVPSIGGPIHILQHPLWEIKDMKDEHGNPIHYDKMRDLYVAGIDSIDIGEGDTSSATKDPSKFCITIKKRAFGTQDPQYVAYYKERPHDVRTAYKIAIAMLQYYNCRANLEASRVSLITWAREHKYMQYFLHRPRATLPDQSRFSKQYGTPATTPIIDHQTDLIANFVEDYYYTIWFDDMLDELNRYTDENKKKFDIIASMGMTELADEELSGQIPIKEQEEVEQWQDVGYYYDENGIKRFGAIPKQQQQNFKVNMDFDDYTRNRTSRPNDYLLGI